MNFLINFSGISFDLPFQRDIGVAPMTDRASSLSF
jgi:hypothetical protein